MLNKKGFEASLSWLFAVIAGIVILLFFVYFSIQHTDLFGKLTAQRAAEELDITFTGIKSTLSLTTLEFGKKIDLKFTCNNEIGEKVYINNKGGKTLKGNIVFAPDGNSDSFNVWTLDWNAPFKITNFIFLNSGEKYDFPTGIYSKVPEEFRDGIIGLSNIGFDPDLKEHYGTLQVNGEHYELVGDAILIASIFSEPEEFECLKNLAVQRAEYLGEIYAQKYDSIQCPTVNEKSDIMYILKNFNPESVEDIRKINEENDLLLRNGCEGIY